MLVAQHQGGVSVLIRSRDNEEGSWTEAEYLGLVPNAPDLVESGQTVVAMTQVGSDRLYMVNIMFELDGTQTRFPMVDITEEVEEKLARKGF